MISILADSVQGSLPSAQPISTVLELPESIIPTPFSSLKYVEEVISYWPKLSILNKTPAASKCYSWEPITLSHRSV